MKNLKIVSNRFNKFNSNLKFNRNKTLKTKLKLAFKINLKIIYK